jgi:predicted N-acetyltransferase YhbS
MRLVDAEGPSLEQILDGTYPIWHEGLTRDAYSQWNRAQMRTAWGRARLRRVALVDQQGRVLASAKRYRIDVRLDGREGWMCGIGAVFTPQEQRGRGHARTLIEAMLDGARRDGALVAGLFSEIGEAFYARLGFSAVPIDEVTVRVNLKGGSPAMLVRSGHESDYGKICRMHATRREGVGFAVGRDADHLHFLLVKKRAFAGLSPGGTRALEFFVAEEGASAVAYVVVSKNQHGWTLEEAGDRDPEGARLGAMLQVLVAREPSHEAPLIRAWWPRAFAVPPQLALGRDAAPSDIFMMRSLSDLRLPTSVDDVFCWRADYF